MSLPICYSCGREILRIDQKIEDTTTYIDFIHQYGDSCTDIIETTYSTDPVNKKYFIYLWGVIEQLNYLKESK